MTKSTNIYKKKIDVNVPGSGVQTSIAFKQRKTQPLSTIDREKLEDRSCNNISNNVKEPLLNKTGTTWKSNAESNLFKL